LFETVDLFNTKKTETDNQTANGNILLPIYYWVGGMAQWLGRRSLVGDFP